MNWRYEKGLHLDCTIGKVWDREINLPYKLIRPQINEPPYIKNIRFAKNYNLSTNLKQALVWEPEFNVDILEEQLKSHKIF